ncbi:MAG: alpha/beta hydrolase [Lachnospiraceae bacterium]|nr:alpha/beta hydrolase [Lachnospiraceae bacterium]
MMIGAAYMAAAWPFFRLMVCKSNKKENNKKIWDSFKHKKINHPRNGYEKEYETGKAWCRDAGSADWWMESHDGLMLHGYYLEAENPERIVLLCHGYRGSGFGDFANIARFLHEHGCTLLIIDERSHGQSEGKYITYGALEQYDVRGWAEKLEKSNTANLPMYLYGMSMGAASVLLASGHRLPEEVKGLISDCGFHSMKMELKDIASNWFHIDYVDLLLKRVDFYCRLCAGFKMDDADTTRALRRNERPVLFFHGENDTFVEKKHTDINYDICNAKKEKFTVPGARHLCSSYVAEDEYREKLMEFFKEND